ncbi:MAG: YbaB/EbfC family nucleoid-associated protein [Pseudomonadales bacterium]|nr:YbaB/EbfC family nucleoid-associated protein [Pseudomonadales bacterium]
MNDLNQLMQQAKQMQEQMQKAQEEAAKRIVSGESGAGLVKIEMTGRHDVRRVILSPELMQEDREVVEDLIAAAINDAVKKIADSSKDVLGSLTGGMKLPEGFKFPF